MSRLQDFHSLLATEQPTATATEDRFVTIDISEDLYTADVVKSSSDLTDSQEIILYLLQLSAGTLSLIGSGAILFKISRNLRRDSSSTTPYDRIILGLSACDVISSLTYALGPFLLPRDTSKRVWAVGNESTCTFLGFFNQLACFWAIWYNCMLSFYYLLTVRLQVKRKDFRRKYEWIMHLPGAIFFSLTAATGFFGGWYSEERYTMTCWIGEVPRGCSECWGGVIVAYIFGGIPSITTLLSVIINNLVVYMFVRKLLLSSPQRETSRERRDDGSSSMRLPTNPRSSSNENTCIESIVSIPRVESESKKPLTRKQRLAKEASTQCFLYVSTFLVTFASASIILVIEGNVANGEEDLRKIYPLLVLNSMLLPLQGFFNVFIYVRPSYDRFREQSPEKSKWFILKQALLESNIPKPTQSNNSQLSSAEKKHSEMRKKSGSNFSMSLENIAEETADQEDSSEIDSERSNVHVFEEGVKP